MSAVPEVDVRPVFEPLANYFLRPVRLIRGYERAEVYNPVTGVYLSGLELKSDL